MRFYGLPCVHVCCCSADFKQLCDNEEAMFGQKIRSLRKPINYSERANAEWHPFTYFKTEDDREQYVKSLTGHSKPVYTWVMCLYCVLPRIWFCCFHLNGLGRDCHVLLMQHKTRVCRSFCEHLQFFRRCRTWVRILFAFPWHDLRVVVVPRERPF